MLAELLSAAPLTQLAAYYANPVTGLPALASAVGLVAYVTACVRSSPVSR